MTETLLIPKTKCTDDSIHTDEALHLPDKSIHHSLAAPSRELESRAWPVPLVEHEGHLCSNGTIGGQPRQEEAQQIQPVQHKWVGDFALGDLRLQEVKVCLVL